MAVVYRPAQIDDLEQADSLTVQSINDLTKRHGFPPMASPRPPQFLTFSLKDDPAGLWVAEEDGRMLGFAFAWACEDFWFLAQLFVATDQQGRGIGDSLLRRMSDHADRVGAKNRVLITFAFNTVSQGLYIRHGFVPRFPVYFVGAPRERLLDRLPAAPIHTTPITGKASDLEALARIDRRALGVSRDKHHRYMIDENIAQGFLFHSGAECVGYGYISGGHIGPLAVSEAEVAGPAFAAALHLAAASGETPNVSAFLPGPCEAVLAVATQAGLRITFPMLLMSSQDTGSWTRYLPRNPGFM